jgi:hypothetical protein
MGRIYAHAIWFRPGNSTYHLSTKEINNMLNRGGLNERLRFFNVGLHSMEFGFWEIRAITIKVT